MDLKDRVAVITGSLSRIGKAIAELFAGEGTNIAVAAGRIEWGGEGF